MLTHHLQDPNCNIAEYIKQTGPGSISMLAGKLAAVARGDPNDASFSSERNKQSKLEKIEQEISRLMLKNNGQLFIVEQYERNGYSKDDLRSGGYFSDEEFLGP